MTVQLLVEEMDDDVVLGTIVKDTSRIRFMANVEWEGRVVMLRELHFPGAGPQAVGIRALRDAVQQMMLYLDVDEIIIDGGVRRSGSALGRAGIGPRTPQRLHFKRERT